MVLAAVSVPHVSCGVGSDLTVAFKRDKKKVQ